MREINNNPNNLNFSAVQKLDQQKDINISATEVNAEQSSLSEMPEFVTNALAAVTGRSLVFKGDSVDNDVKFC